MVNDAGDEELFRLIYPGLRRAAAAVGSGATDPDDLVQEAVARVLRKGRLSDLEDAASYLRRIVVNLAIDDRRRRGRTLTMLARVRGEGRTEGSYPSDLAELERVSPRTRAVLWLVDVEGFTFAEAADLLGCTAEAARALASRGRATLRHSLSNEQEGLSHGSR